MKGLATIREAYTKPEAIKNYSNLQWSQLLKEGYATGLLGRIYYLFKKNQLIEFIPNSIVWHFSAAYTYSNSYHQDVLIEVEYVNKAFKMSGQIPIFLKGVAYLLANDEAMHGRTFSDIDIFINKKHLSAVERFLHWHGWTAGDVDHYDDRYYRKWMHEIPALTHKTRGSTLDVHHNLLPQTSRIPFDSMTVEEKADVDLGVLSAEDRIIHSIVHLFLESEFEKGMRDMTDIDLLIQQHQSYNENFLVVLVDRAIALGVAKLVFYALRYASTYLNTPVTRQARQKLAVYAPNKLQLKLMDHLFTSVLFRPLSLERTLSNRLAHFLMFIRGHWIRMPLHLLIPHLCHKAFITPFTQSKKTIVNK